MSEEIPCEQPFEDGTHCKEPRGHHLVARVDRSRGRCADCEKPDPTPRTTETEEQA